MSGISRTKLFKLFFIIKFLLITLAFPGFHAKLHKRNRKRIHVVGANPFNLYDDKENSIS